MKRRETPVDWVAVRMAYVTGNVGYAQIAKKYGVSTSIVQKHMAKEGWVEEKKRYQAELAKRKASNIAKSEAAKRERIFEVADKMLDIIEQGLADGTIPGNGKGFRDVTGALKDIKDIKELRNPLEEQEQIARIERLRAETKRAQEMVNADITITIAPELEEYTD